MKWATQYPCPGAGPPTPLALAPSFSGPRGPGSSCPHTLLPLPESRGLFKGLPATSPIQGSTPSRDSPAGKLASDSCPRLVRGGLGTFHWDIQKPGNEAPCSPDRGSYSLLKLSTQLRPNLPLGRAEGGGARQLHRGHTYLGTTGRSPGRSSITPSPWPDCPGGSPAGVSTFYPSNQICEPLSSLFLHPIIHPGSPGSQQRKLIALDPTLTSQPANGP